MHEKGIYMDENARFELAVAGNADMLYCSS